MALPFVPKRDPVSGLPGDYYAQYLTRAQEDISTDLGIPGIGACARDFDAIACAGDFHGVALGAVAAAILEKPLVIAGVRQVVTVGGYVPGMSLCYVDDFFTLGASWPHTTRSLGPAAADITATYQAQVREYQRLRPSPGGERASDRYLASARDEMYADLYPNLGSFDALVSCGGSLHDLALASVAAGSLGVPLVIICTRHHEEVVSHIVTVGDFDPRMRLCHMAPESGPQRRHALEYMNQGSPALITASYCAGTRSYESALGAIAGARLAQAS
jgi:hypothetical protein